MMVDHFRKGKDSETNTKTVNNYRKNKTIKLNSWNFLKKRFSGRQADRPNPGFEMG